MVSISLTVLWVVAFVFSLLDIIAYSPLAMLASLGVLGTVVFLATLLFAKLFGVKAHTESSYITALILFFIFTPSLEISGLVTLGFVGLMAAASKFLLVWRGRHIFNPAAIAAFVIGLTGLGFASWWVATPPLFLFTFILGFLIIQKTRRFFTGGLFLGLTIPLVFISLLVQGEPLSNALVLMLSWPIFYFSGFMLTEPQTLPPKKWQQAIEVVIVALLFAIPFHIGEFASSPALALVVGNLVAFIFSRRHAIILKYKGSKKLTPASHELTFSPVGKVRFESGQYIEITVPHKKVDGRGERRSFSVTSSALGDDLKLGIKFYEPSSSLKKALTDLPIGATITATGINGDFTLPKDESKPLLFVAGGIGVTPYISHLRTLKQAKKQRDIVLVYSVSNPADLAYKDVIESSGVKVIAVTKTEETIAANNWTHVNEPFITSDMLAKYVPDIATRQAYISGPPFMIDSVKGSLKKLGARQIKTDYFIGY